MAKGEKAEGEAPKKASRALLLAVPLALLLGGASFYAVYAGLLPLPFLSDPGAGGTEETAQADPPALEAESAAARAEIPAFVALEPLVIALGPSAGARHLKLRVQIETAPETRDAVEAVRPRIADVLNTFLRAVDESAVTEPHAMIRLRAQMLRRVRLVAPEGAVRDLLIEQFVLN